MREPLRFPTLYWHDADNHSAEPVVLRPRRLHLDGIGCARVIVTDASDPVAKAERAVLRAADVLREVKSYPNEAALWTAVDALRAAKRRRP